MILCSCRSTRYEVLSKIFDRVHAKLRTNDHTRDSGINGLERDETSEEESSHVDSSLVPKIDQDDVVLNVDGDSIDDDIDTVPQYPQHHHRLSGNA